MLTSSASPHIDAPVPAGEGGGCQGEIYEVSGPHHSSPLLRPIIYHRCPHSSHETQDLLPSLEPGWAFIINTADVMVTSDCAWLQRLE